MARKQHQDPAAGPAEGTPADLGLASGGEPTEGAAEPNTTDSPPAGEEHVMRPHPHPHPRQPGGPRHLAQTPEPSVEVDPAVALARFNQSVDAVAGAIKKLTEAGLGGAAAGEVALRLWDRAY